MRVLAVESSSGDYLSFALWDTDQPRALCAERELRPGRELAELLVPELQALLSSTGWTPSSVDLLAAGLGPGSFTGARIGLSTFKGLALATGRPLTGVSSLDCMDPGPDRFAGARLTLLDAGRDDLYVQCLQGSTCLLAPCVVSRAGLSDVLSPLVPEKHIACSGPLAAGLRLEGWAIEVVADAPFDRPRATQVAALAAARAASAGALAGLPDAAAIVPLYVRPADITAPRPKSSR